MLIHALAAVAVYEIARLTLAELQRRGRFRGDTDFLPLAIAVVWAVHPLQTQAVTYIYQRIESMAGMFCLVSLACFAHAAAAGWSRRWLAGCVAACALAMASKESAIVLPLVILAYDWTFWADPPTAILGRLRLYALLAAATVIVGLQLWLQRSAYGEFREPGIGPIAYAMTQPGVILHYLRLAAWPTGQCLDYGWPIATSFGEILAPLAVICGMVIATCTGLARRHPWGWLGAVFFLTLAPTSSLMPVLAPAAEHRMYLPLAAAVAAVACSLTLVAGGLADRGTSPAGLRRSGRAATLVLIGVAVAFGVLTHRRNQAYHSRETMWEDVAEKRPGNFMAAMWMAGFAAARGDDASAESHAEAAVRLRPSCDIFAQLSQAARSERRPDAAAALLERYLLLVGPTLSPDDRPVLGAKAALASTLASMRRREQAESLCLEIVDSLDRRLGAGYPATIDCRLILTQGMLARGDTAAALALADRNHAAAVATLGAWHPSAQRAASSLASCLLATGDAVAAERVLREGLEAAMAAGWRRSVDATHLQEALAGLLESTAQYESAFVQRKMMLDQTLAEGRGPADAIRARLAVFGAEAARARQMRQPAEEEAISGQAVEASIAGLGVDDPLTQRVIVNHAAILHRGGKPEAAERHLRESLRRATIGRPDGTASDLTVLQSGLADLYDRIGRPEEAVGLRKTVLHASLERHGPQGEATRRATTALEATKTRLEKKTPPCRDDENGG